MKKPIAKTHKQWLAGQRKKLGGSDIPTVLGISGSTLYDLWAYKTGRIEGFGGNDLTYIGIHTENLVARNFAEQYNVKVFQDNYVRFSDERPYLGVNLDRRIQRHEKFGFRKGVQQIKTTSDNTFNLALEKFPKVDLGVRIPHEKLANTPFKYIAQLLIEMYCTDAEFGVLSALILGDFTRKFHHAFFEREDWEETIEDILRLADDFWYNHVVAYIKPKLETLEDLATEYDEGIPGYSKVDDEIMKKVDEMNDLKDDHKKYNKIRDELKVMIQSEMEENETALDPSGENAIATWKTSHKQKFDEQAFEKDHPLLYAKYLKDTSSRRFNFKV